MTLVDERPEPEEKKCSVCLHDAHKRAKCNEHRSDLLSGHCDCWWEEADA